MNDFLFKDEGYQLIGAALEGYNEQGHHLSEDIYQASLETSRTLRQKFKRLATRRSLDKFMSPIRVRSVGKITLTE